MNQISIAVGFLIIFVHLKIILASTADDTLYQDYNLTTVEIIKKYGYPAETHTTESEDGYILEMHRIPHGKNSTNLGFPILITHGLMGESSSFLLLATDSPAFLLADEGYDVWLGNNRGTPHTMRHRSLSPKDNEFWDFSWHESGVYDLPAQIDYICNYTKYDKILFIGYSMGSTEYFVMASERPEYQNKIRGAIMLAPVAFVKHLKPNLCVIISGFLVTPETFLKPIFLPSQKFAEHCSSNAVQVQLCKTTILTSTGMGTEEFDVRCLKNLIAHTTDWTSAKQLAHYAQLSTSGRFCQYDHGVPKNWLKYGQPIPPEYNLNALKTPMSIFLAQNDYFVHPRDLDSLLSRLSSVESIDYVPYKFFTHLDFITAKHIKELVYDKIFERIKYLLR